MEKIGRRRLLAAGFFSLLPACNGSAKAKTAAFADIAECRAFVIAAFRKRPGMGSVIADPRDPAKFTVRIGKWSSNGDVSNLFAYLSTYPDEDVGQVTERFVNSVLEARDRVVVDDKIVAVIRHRDYIAEAAKRGATLLHEPFGGDLVIVYMLDQPNAMSPLSTRDLPGRSAASLRATALSNMKRWLPKVVSDDSLGDGVLYYVEDNTMLSTSLLLLDEFWSSIRGRFPGDVLIALPRKDQLFIFDDGKAEVKAQVRQLIDVTIEEGANLLSPGLYARRDGKIMLVTDDIA